MFDKNDAQMFVSIVSYIIRKVKITQIYELAWKKMLPWKRSVNRKDGDQKPLFCPKTDYYWNIIC
jgi:hypothetical protein